MKSIKASRRKVRQALNKFKLYTVEELEEKEEPLELDESELEEETKVTFPRRRKLDWDDD